MHDSKKGAGLTVSPFFRHDNYCKSTELSTMCGACGQKTSKQRRSAGVFHFHSLVANQWFFITDLLVKESRKHPKKMEGLPFLK